jgi:hypothetical protein
VWDAISLTRRDEALAMTLKPIRGAPIDAPIPDFPTGTPGPLAVPTSRVVHRPVEPLPTAPSPVTRPGPVEIRGDGHSILTFRCIPEVAAINRASMTISITGESIGDYSPQTMPHFDLAIDEAKAFLLALRGGDLRIVIVDHRTATQLEFTIAEGEPRFTVRKPGREETARNFRVGRDYDVKAMATQLLAELGP